MYFEHYLPSGHGHSHFYGSIDAFYIPQDVHCFQFIAFQSKK